ncbi:WYL domain-containing protein [Paenibacillus aurantiacus]|uniref:WYL domain-containing protein n=1 Tax=Paenibacillus aurantiacus TaxID=1936118 RepID=A0ABV5KHJ2_9BACL
MGSAWKGYAWYLYAYCRLRRDYRTFRLSRISDIRIHLEHFASRRVRMEELDARWGNNDTGPLIHLTLRFSSRMRARVEEAFGLDKIDN